jgi:Histidine kinase-, DNA gyrase B-, and HSP90-like ATPase
MNWFDVDKAGLAKLLEKKGKSFAIFELLQNAWDTNATCVVLKLEPIDSSPFVRVTVEDNDPEGFSKLEHAFTLFAESDKKSDSTKRGRFNLGEKLVLALCRKAEVHSTKGIVTFDDVGRSVNTREKARRESGSCFTGEMRMTRDELAEVRAKLFTLIVPTWPTTYVDGATLKRLRPVKEISCTLDTEISNAEGFLRKTKRKATIELYDTGGMAAYLYEMGIPVVEIPGDRWHVNVSQKIPLNIDRDNVTPAYLRSVRVEVLNATTDLL